MMKARSNVKLIDRTEVFYPNLLKGFAHRQHTISNGVCQTPVRVVAFD